MFYFIYGIGYVLAYFMFVQWNLKYLKKDVSIGESVFLLIISLSSWLGFLVVSLQWCYSIGILNYFFSTPLFKAKK